MPATRADLLAFLDGHEIPYALHDHPPVFTVEESEAHTGHLPGAHVKNLFLEDKTGGLWLITAEARRPIKVNALARRLGAPRVRFAAPERLMEVLGVIPGAVTPLGLINDAGRRVRFVIDNALLKADLVNVHPLDNAGTLTLKPRDLLRCLEAWGYQAEAVDFAATAA